MRWFAFGLLILIVVPTIARGDAADDAQAKAECDNLVRRGNYCVDFFWTEYDQFPNERVEQGPECEPHVEARKRAASAEDRLIRVGHWMEYCECNRRAYQDFGVAERVKYHWCK